DLAAALPSGENTVGDRKIVGERGAGDVDLAVGSGDAGRFIDGCAAQIGGVKQAGSAASGGIEGSHKTVGGAGVGLLERGGCGGQVCRDGGAGDVDQSASGDRQALEDVDAGAGVIRAVH